MSSLSPIRVLAARSLAACALLVACGGEPPAPDAGGQRDGGIELPDAALDAGRDGGAGRPDGGVTLPDAGDLRDAGDVRDAGIDGGWGGQDASFPDAASDVDSGTPVDAGPRCADTCVPLEPCRVARCEAEACLQEFAADGTDCGETAMGLPEGVCIAGTCTMRGCGDGYREPGGIGRPSAERCDDGNRNPDDLCDNACLPSVTTAFVETRMGTMPMEGLVTGITPHGGGAAIGIDGSGAALVAWTQSEWGMGGFFEVYPAVAQRFDAVGAPVSTPLNLGIEGSLAQVAGLDEGWLVAVRLFSGRLSLRWVHRDGRIDVGPDIDPSAELREFALATLAGPSGRTALVTWVERNFALGDTSIYARRYAGFSGTLGTIDASPIPIAPSAMEPMGVRHSLTVAAEGERWVVAYVDESVDATVVTRRFLGGSPQDTVPVPIAATGESLAVTMLGNGDVLVAYELAGDLELGLLPSGMLMPVVDPSISASPERDWLPAIAALPGVPGGYLGAYVSGALSRVTLGSVVDATPISSALTAELGSWSMELLPPSSPEERPGLVADDQSVWAVWVGYADSGTELGLRVARLQN